MPTPTPPVLTIREQIIRELATRVDGVRRMPTYSEQDLPLTVITEGDDAGNGYAYDMHRVTMPVTIARAALATMPMDDAWHQQGNAMLGDLITDIYAGGEDLNGLAEGMDYTSGSVKPVADGDRAIEVAVTINVRYAFVRGNPFSNDPTPEDEE
jgi:hypothetical protein